MPNRKKYLVTKDERKRHLQVATAIVLGLFIVSMTATIPRRHGEPQSTVPTTEKTIDDSSESLSPTNETSKTPVSKAPIPETTIPETHLVTKVVDGDTIKVDGNDVRIRLIGVNTPETVSSSKPVECYGPEASSYLSNLILGKYVGLESDSNVGDTDVYNRPLRYVYYQGENLSYKLILNGYGKEASYGNDYKYRSSFVAAESDARNNGRGLWMRNGCNGAT